MKKHLPSHKEMEAKALPPEPRASSTVVALRSLPGTGRLSDDAVAAAAATGDAAAVGALFDRFRPRVTRFLGRLLRGSEEVEDLTQATFLLIARGQCRFDGRSQAATWILGIAANVARDHRRATRRRFQFLDAFRQAAPLRAKPVAPDRIATARASIDRAQDALRELPQGQQLAFVLCELEGVPTKEAAAILHTSEANIWKRVSEARKALRYAVGVGS